MKEKQTADTKTKGLKIVVTNALLESFIEQLSPHRRHIVRTLHAGGLNALLDNLNIKSSKEFLEEVASATMTQDRFANLAMKALVPEYRACLVELDSLKIYKDTLIECWKVLFTTEYFKGQKHDFDGFLTALKVSVAVAEKMEEMQALASKMSGIDIVGSSASSTAFKEPQKHNPLQPATPTDAGSNTYRRR